MTIRIVPPTAGVRGQEAWNRDAALAISQLITAVGAASGVTDGDKGDIVVSGSGTVWSFDSSVVTAFAKTILDDASASAARTTLGLVTVASSGSASDLTSGTLAAARMPALTGDVTTSAGAVATTIANNAVTYAKMQDVSATKRAIGRNTAGSGDPEEVTYSQILDWVGSAAQGDILYRGASTWDRLAAGTSGQHLQTAGSGATPSWATPARVLITETVTSSSATNVSFTSIPSTYRDLEVRIRGRGTKAATLVDIRIRFNADTGSNYDGETQQANSTTNSNFGGVAGTSAYIGNLAAASATASVADYIRVEIADYRGTTFQKTGQYIAGLKTGTAAATNLFNEVGSIWWRSTSAITQIDVFPSGNGFVDGTVVSLYGLM